MATMDFKPNRFVLLLTFFFLFFFFDEPRRERNLADSLLQIDRHRRRQQYSDAREAWLIPATVTYNIFLSIDLPFFFDGGRAIYDVLDMCIHPTKT